MQDSRHPSLYYKPRNWRTGLLATTWLCVGLAPLAIAGPEGGQVAYGQANISASGPVTTIHQTTDRAVIDWTSFNIQQHEEARFIQPGATSIAVNRIHDANPSAILGKLTANGQVILINPNGVVFGQGAQIDVNSLVVSTASPTDRDAHDFANGLRHDLPLSVSGRPDATIINKGVIHAAEAGLVGFVAPNVVNDGVIVANSGTVMLASGDTATLDLYGDGLIDVAVSNEVKNQLISQGGLIQANGGKVVLTAAAGQKIVNSLINMDGVIEAKSIGQKDGKIILSAGGASSKVAVKGKLDASEKRAGEKGGAVTVTADDVRLAAGSLITVLGDRGGGSIRIGGDYQGKGSLPNAKNVMIESGAFLKADALTQGDGGRVIVWSDKATRFAGTISATGGILGGDGGFVETSGKNTLNATGHVDLRALAEAQGLGETGTWLLDPTDITIYNRAYGGATDNDSSFLTSYLEGQSASANIVLSAAHDIYFDMTGDHLTAATNRSISMTAGNAIQALSAGALNVSGTGGISLTSSNGIDLGSAFDLSSNGGVIALNAGTGTSTTNIIQTGAGNLSIIADDVVFNGNMTGTGTVTLRPYTNNGRRIRVNWFGGDFNLDTSDLNHLVAGWSNVVIGDDSNVINIGDSVFNNPMTFRASDHSFNTVDVYGHITGPGFRFTGNYVDVRNTITTSGQDVIFDSVMTPYNDTVISTAGGDVVFNNNSRVNDSGSGFTINTAGGDISFNYLIEAINGTAVGKNVVLNAGSGSISFADTVDGGYNLDLTGSTITFADKLGDNMPLGTLTINTVNGLVLPSITADTIFARASGANSDIVIASGASLTSSNSGTGITLAAGRNFMNNGGSTGLVAGNGGRWLVYSTDEVDSVGEELLPVAFTRYNCTYGGSCPSLGTGNGLLYTASAAYVPPVVVPQAPTPVAPASPLPSTVQQPLQIVVNHVFGVPEQSPVGQQLSEGGTGEAKESSEAAQTPWYEMNQSRFYNANGLVTFTPALKHLLGV